MRIFALGLAGFALVLTASAATNEQRKPVGVEIQGHVVKVKTGYAFQRATTAKVYSYAVAGPSRNQISGTYNCSCDGSGSCNAELTKTTLTCVPAGGCKGCQLTVTIGKNGKLQVLRPGGSSGD